MSLDKDLKREIRVETGMSFGRNTPTPSEVETATRRMLESKLKQKRQSLDSAAREKVIKEIGDDLLGFGPIEPLLRDPLITEVMINGPYENSVEKLRLRGFTKPAVRGRGQAAV